MEKYKCIICGYIYNPEKGDLSSNIEPNTSFVNLPDSWLCPFCDADKEQFIEL